MPPTRLCIRSVSRRKKDGAQETLEFDRGANLLVGEGNTGKTQWLQAIDYILGDEPTAEERKDPDNVLFTLFDSASALILIGDTELTVERRWNEPGGVSRVIVNGDARNVKDFCRELLELLGIPLVKYPQGNPYAARKWPELGWRILCRHVYRRETAWSDFADKQPEVDQHATLMQFVGAAEHIFSPEYGTLVAKNQKLVALEARKEQFMAMLDEIARDLMGAPEFGVALTPQSIAEARARLKGEEADLTALRADLLRRVRSDAESMLAESKRPIPDFSRLSENLVALEGQRDVSLKTRQAVLSRLAEMQNMRQLLVDEAERLGRAQEGGRILSNLRVTHCPSCDRPIEAKPSDEACYVCGRELVTACPEHHSARVEFEVQRVNSELEEVTQLIAELEQELHTNSAVRQHTEEEIEQLRATLTPVRQAAAAVVPPELFLVDAGLGRIQEKNQQLSRIERVLSQRDELEAEIKALQKEIDGFDAAATEKSSDLDLDVWAVRLRDAMNTYLNRILALNPKSWIGQAVSVSLNERSFKFRVGEGSWKKLGATQRLYFFFAYQYALLSLSQYDGAHYPGIAIIDFPANLEDRAAIKDKENFVLQPFIELLATERLQDCQLIAAGRAFEGLADVRRYDFYTVWK